MESCGESSCIAGRSGHIELPQGDWRNGGAVDAIRHARLYLDHFDQLNRDWALRKGHPYLALPCQILAAQLTAGDYPTSFADRAVITFNAQYLPRERDEFGLGSAVKKEIESFVMAVAATDPWLKEHPPQIEWMVDADCAETPADHPFVQLLSGNVTRLGIATSVEGMGFHTDMGWFVNVGIPTVNFGPGNPRLAHQNDEWIAESDLVRAAQAIALTILDWCGVET